MVARQQPVAVRAPVLDAQGAAEEVRDVGQRGPPPDRLPVDDGERPVRPVGAEQQVVEPVVAVHEPVGAARLLVVGEVCVVARGQPLAHPAVLGRDAALVALEEAGEQRREQRLPDRRFAREPRRRGERRRAQRGCVQPREALDGECRQSADRSPRSRRPAPRGRRLRAAGRTSRPRGRTTRGSTGRAARRAAARPLRRSAPRARTARAPRRSGGCVVLGRHLEDDRGRAGAVLVLDAHAVAGAHLPRADALGGERRDRAAADLRGQPFGRQVGGRADHAGDAIARLCGAPGRYATGSMRAGTCLCHGVPAKGRASPRT